MAEEPVIPGYSEAEGYRIAVFARSGHGKSYLARWLVERLLDENWQVLVLEPVAEWETLREAYEVLVFGGEAGDLPLAPRAIVEALASGASAVANLEGMRLNRQRQLVWKTLELLYRRWQQIRRPLLLVLEEAQLWAPQRYSRATMQLLETVDVIAKTGRKLGLNLLLISQRPASVSKDVVSQSNVLFLGAFSDPRDVKAAREYATALGAAIGQEELSTLSKGEFIEIVGGRKLHVRAPATKTRHAGATPGLRAPPPPPTMSELIERLRELAGEEQEDTVTLPRREYEELLARLRALEERARELEEEKRRLLETVEIVKRIRIVGEAAPAAPAAQPPVYAVPLEALDTLSLLDMRVLRYLARRGGCASFAEIQSAVKATASRLRARLARLHEQGLIDAPPQPRGRDKVCLRAGGG